MASAILVNVKEEVTCPICLELLKEPLSLGCGHNFCQRCITSNYQSTKGQNGEGSCPVCRVTYQLENLRPNRSVANIVERLKEVKLSPEEGQKVYHCARHGEKLLLFCEEDRKVICWLCERSQEHRGHHTILVEEVAQEYREKLQTALRQLTEKEEESKEWTADIQKERTFWKNEIQEEIGNVQAQFLKRRIILDEEEKNELGKLKKKEEDILNSLAASENELLQQRQLVRDLISDLKQQLEGSTIELLQDMNDIMERYKILTLQKPKTFPKEHRRVFEISDLNQKLQVSQELTDVKRFWVHVTLEPSNNPNFVISPDRRQITYEYKTSFLNKKYHEGVLGSPVITSGKHYWEVDVSKKSAWILGLNSGSFTLSRYCIPHRENILFKARHDCWVIRLNNFVYNAIGDYPGPHPQLVTLALPAAPQRIGVFVDFEARTVSFYSVTNPTFLIYKFSPCVFPTRVYPYFNPMQCPEPMTLCDVQKPWPRA